MSARTRVPADGARIPIGRFRGALAAVPAGEPGAHAVRGGGAECVLAPHIVGGQGEAILPRAL